MCGKIEGTVTINLSHPCPWLRSYPLAKISPNAPLAIISTLSSSQILRISLRYPIVRGLKFGHRWTFGLLWVLYIIRTFFFASLVKFEKKRCQRILFYRCFIMERVAKITKHFI